MVSRYVKPPEGLCLFPPPHHYRMMPPQRADGYSVSNQAYVTQPPPSQGQQGQPPPQGVNQQQQGVGQQQQGPPGGLRGIPQGQAGQPPPPNQAPTPPNAVDQLKVQAIQQQQQPPMNHLFVQPQVRPPSAATYFQRAGPPNQGPRMQNHNSRPQQPPLFTGQPQTQFVLQQPMYITSNSGVPYASYAAQRPPAGYVQQLAATQTVYGPPIAAYNPYNTTPNPPNQVYNLNNYYSAPVMRQASAPPVNPNPNQNVMPAVPMAPSIPQHQPPFQRQPPNRRRANAVAIIDPETGADRLQEIYEDNSHPPSGDSSARQTPQPTSAAQNSYNKEVQATFAKQVMQALEERPHEPQPPHEQPSPPQHCQQQHQELSQVQASPPQHPVAHNHMEQGLLPPPQNQQQPQGYLPGGPPPPHHQHQQQLSKMEHVVQSSKLQPSAKEFVLPTAVSSTAAKETPIVSANCDAVEVTLPNKPPKERDSPVKGRPKARQEPSPAQSSSGRERKDSTKEAAPKEALYEREVVKEEEVRQTADRLAACQQLQPEAAPVEAVRQPPALAPKDAPKEALPPAEKKKKDAMCEVAATATAVTAASQQQTQDVGTNAKKHNAHRAAPSKHHHQPPQTLIKATTVAPPQNCNNNNYNHQKIGTATPTPQPLPPKTASKAHKKHELNQKGANKEGTDMDAFNDNVQQVVLTEMLEVEEVNSNTIPAVVTIDDAASTATSNDVINANMPGATLVSPALAAVIVDNDNEAVPMNVSLENSKNAEPAPAVAVALKAPPNEPPAVKKSSFDITDIVREKPKPFVSPVTSGQDEPDRVVVAVVSGAQASTKTGGLESKLPYKDGQWSPANQAGLKVYQKDFLLALKDLPASRKTPDNIPDVIFMLEDNNRGRLSDGRSSMGGRSDFTPSFNYGPNKSSSQRGMISKRPSQGKMESRSINKAAKPPIKLSISVREDVKLHETENAWRPARLLRGEAATDDDKRTAGLYKRVRGILNKLTPQKFDTLLMQIKALPIDNAARLQGVIDLVFEKAVDEPNFSVAYANMCKELALMQVPTNNSTPEKPEVVNFRKLLITRCQVEFEKNSIDEEVRNKKVKEIDETTDPEKKKDMLFDLEEYDRRLRMKSVGNIRFIGELFKQNMLTINIMMRCLSNLLDNRDEESLECLCKLLTTIGKDLESRNVGLQDIFGPMSDIIDKKEKKVSSRIRFMLQDVLDLRSSKWVPRRQDFNPKTIDQIQKEAADEHLNIQMMNSGPMPLSQQQQQHSRKDDRMGGGSDRRGAGGGGRGNGNKVGDEGWITMGGSSKGRAGDRYTGQNDRFSVQTDKLKTKAPMINEPLGNSAMFGNWGKGSVGSTMKAQQTQPSTANMYAALENMDGDKRGMNSRPGSTSTNKDSYHSKGNSLERNYKFDTGGGRSSRSGSQQRPGDRQPPPASMQRPVAAPAQKTAPVAPAPAQPKAADAAPAQPRAANATTAVAPALTEDQIHRRVTNGLDEYVAGNCSVDEYFEEISSADIPPDCIKEIIRDSYLHVLEKNSHARLATGNLFACLVSQGRIQLEDYCLNLEDVLSQVEDLVIDIPKIWDYLAELMACMVCTEALPLKRLHKSCIILIGQRQAHKLLVPLFKLVVSKKGPNFLQSAWGKSGLQLCDFMDSSLVQSFIDDNQFEFLVGGKTSAGQSKTSYEEIQQKLLEFLKANSDIDEISNWVIANVGDRVKENKFIRALATAIFQDSIDEDGKKLKLMRERLLKHLMLFTKYVDNNEEFELQCLYALQALINRMEHPQGLLLEICDTLYELITFSQESFVLWWNSKDPAEQEGKGVAVKQLTSFFCRLRENEEEETSGSEPDAS